MHSLPISLPGFEVAEVISTAEQLIICATSQSVQAECPACHEASQRVHSYYQRSPRDLPVSGQAVQITTSCATISLSQHAVLETNVCGTVA